MTHTYYFYGYNADEAEVSAEVTPTMEALGDQPFRVRLLDLSDGHEKTIIVEAGSSLQAAKITIHDWLASQGLPSYVGDRDLKTFRL